MSTQITVRLPDDLVSFIDAEVAEGTSKSRADLVTKVLRREQRRRRALQDLEIIRQCDGDPYPKLAGVAEHAAHLPMDID